MKRVYFVRHGETTYNATDRVQGADVPLSETGMHQANKVAARCQQLDFNRVVASTFTRAQQTAAPIAKMADKPLLSSELFVEILRPTKFIDGLRSDEEYKQFSEAENDNAHDPDWRYDDEENLTEAMERVRKAVAYLKSLEGDTLVVSHGRFLKYVYQYLMCGEQFNPEVWSVMRKALYGTNTGITMFEFDGDYWKLVTFNDIAHFAD